MFQFLDDDIFAAPVTVAIPGRADETFTARFRLIDLASLDAAGEIALVDALLVDASDIVGPDEAPLSWSPALRQRLLEHPAIRPALLKAFITAAREVREKNSWTSLAGGPAAT